MSSINYFSSPCAIHISTEHSCLDEFIALNHPLHLLDRHVVIMHAMLLAGSRLTCRMRDREAKCVGKLLEQTFQQGALARAAWAANHQWTWTLFDHFSCETRDDCQQERVREKKGERYIKLMSKLLFSFGNLRREEYE